MIKSIVVMGGICLTWQLVSYTLGAKFEWLQTKDKLSWKQRFKRNRYELTLQFEDGRFATYHLFANYSNYQADDLLVKLFETNSFVGIQEDGRVFYYRSSQISRIEAQKYPLRHGKKASL